VAFFGALAATTPVDLVCAVDLSGSAGVVARRKALVGSFVRFLGGESPQPGQLRVAIVTCTDHVFSQARGNERLPVTDDFPLGSPADALAWLASKQRADAQSRDCAPVEDLLNEALSLLRGSGPGGCRARLVTLAGRPPHPYPARSGGAVACPLHISWERVASDLDAAGVVYAVVADALPDGPAEARAVWERLGPAGQHELGNVTARQLVEDLGLLDGDRGQRTASSPARPPESNRRASAAAAVPLTQVRADLHRVGIWGAAASGKTTFLSSLFIAVAQRPDQARLRGGTDESTDFIIRNTHVLNQQRRFPQATLTHTPLEWTLQMTVPNPSRGIFRRGPERVLFDFNIDMRDVAGADFAALPEPVPSVASRLDDLAPGPPDDVAAYLGGSEGLLLLIDPIREHEVGDAYEYFFGTLLRIAQNVPVPLGQRLPHYVAVCVTKFDAPIVYQFARDSGYLSYRQDDLSNMPRVHDDEAERFTRHLFEDMPRSDIDLVTTGLRQYFYPERIKFFISSAVGFYVGPSGVFDESEYQNVAEGSDGESVIRGQVRPINVVEPFLWLGERMAPQR